MSDGAADARGWWSSLLGLVVIVPFFQVGGDGEGWDVSRDQRQSHEQMCPIPALLCRGASGMVSSMSMTLRQPA